MSDLEAELRKTSSSNLGLTTTVKDQVEHIEVLKWGSVDDNWAFP